MSINQLIATQYQRTRPDSPMQQMANIEQMKAQKEQNRLASEQGKYALAGMGRAQEMEGLKFAANIKNQIDQMQDPAQKDQAYRAALDMARRVGHNVDAWPQQYNQQADMMLGMARAQTAGGEDKSLDQKAFEYYLESVGGSFNADGTINTSSMSPQDAARAQAAAIKLGLAPRATGSSALTIAEQGKTNIVGQSQAAIDAMRAQASEQSKLGVREEVMPQIIEKETTAGLEAKDRFETEKRQRAAQQGLKYADRTYQNLKGMDLDKIYGKNEGALFDWLRSQEGVDAKAQIDQLMAMLVSAGKGELKGQGSVSDADQRVIERAKALLGNYSISPELAEQALDEAMEAIYNSAGKKWQSGKKDTEEKYYNVDGVLYRVIGGTPDDPLLEVVE